MTKIYDAAELFEKAAENTAKTGELQTVLLYNGLGFLARGLEEKLKTLEDRIIELEGAKD